MYDYNLTTQEISDYNADMLELRGELFVPLTDEEIEEMYADAKARGLAE